MPQPDPAPVCCASVLPRLVDALKPSAVAQLYELSRQVLEELERLLDEWDENGGAMGALFSKPAWSQHRHLAPVNQCTLYY